MLLVKEKITYKLGWLAIGTVIFSPLIVNITMQILGFPFMVPELFFIPLFLIYKKDIQIKINYSCLFIAIICLLLLLSISLLKNKFAIGAIVSTFRGYLYMFIAFSFFYNQKLRSLDWLFYLSIGSLLGWIMVSIHVISNSLIDIKAVTGNITALIFVISIPVILRKDKYLIPVIIICTILLIFSGMRRLIVVAIVTFGLSLLLTILKQKIKNKIKYILFTIAVFAGYLFLYPTIETMLVNNSPELYRRLILKSELLLNNNASESDQFRHNMLVDFTKNIGNDIFPKGYVTKRSLDNDIYIDFPIYELSYMLGVFIFIILVLLLIFRLGVHLRQFLLLGVRESGLCVIWGSVIILLLFIEGTFLNYPFVTPFTGYVLARIFSSKNLIA